MLKDIVISQVDGLQSQAVSTTTGTLPHDSRSSRSTSSSAIWLTLCCTFPTSFVTSIRRSAVAFTAAAFSLMRCFSASSSAFSRPFIRPKPNAPNATNIMVPINDKTAFQPSYHHSLFHPAIDKRLICFAFLRQVQITVALHAVGPSALPVRRLFPDSQDKHVMPQWYAGRFAHPHPYLDTTSRHG